MTQKYRTGGVATDVGTRAFKLYLQGVFECRFPCDKNQQSMLVKMFKSFLPEPG